MAENSYEQKFTVGAGARLTLGNIRGTVQVTPGNDGEIVVTAVKVPGSGDLERTEIRMSQDSDGRVRVETRYDKTFFPFFGDRICKVDYTVQAPRDCSMDLSSVSGSVSAEGFQGIFKVSTVSGPVTLKDLTGGLKVNGVSGEILVEKVAGELTFETVSGRVTISEAHSPAVQGSTVSGEVRVELVETGGGPYNVSSVSGSIIFIVPPDSQFTVKHSSVSGRLTTTLPVSASSQQFGKGYAEINGGGAPMHCSSVSGELKIVASEADLARAPHAGKRAQPVADDRPASPSHQEILDKIERGEITVDEGIKLLQKG